MRVMKNYQDFSFFYRKCIGPVVVRLVQRGPAIVSDEGDFITFANGEGVNWIPRDHVPDEVINIL